MKNLLITSLLFPLISCGQTQSGIQKTPQEVKTILEKTYADQKLTVKSVQPAPIKGWFEVVLPDNQIVYVDSAASHLLAGSLYDLKNKKDLTAERIKELNVINFASLPLDDAIKEVRGNGKDKVVVFSDPECPFCHRLEKEFAQMTDITIYTFLMPIPSLHPSAPAKAVQIWCQENRTTAWTTWMREAKAPTQVADCANPVEKNVQLGEKLGFSGTPTLVFPNGQVQQGYAPHDILQELIKKNQ